MKNANQLRRVRRARDAHSAHVGRCCLDCSACLVSGVHDSVSAGACGRFLGSVPRRPHSEACCSSQQTRLLTAVLYLSFLGLTGSSVFLITLLSQAAGQPWRRLSNVWVAFVSLATVDVVLSVRDRASAHRRLIAMQQTGCYRGMTHQSLPWLMKPLHCHL